MLWHYNIQSQEQLQAQNLLSNQEDVTISSEQHTAPVLNTTTKFTSVVQEHGQLHIAGNKMVDKNNQPVQLRGMSFFWSQWMGQYYTKDVVRWLKEDWKCTVVRAAMGVDEEDGYLQSPEKEKEKIFTIIDAAIEEGIYVIVDWHSHHAENYLAEAKAFFSEVAQKYGHLPNLIYETYNEPIASPWTAVLKPYHEAVIAAIRQHDPDNIVICGTRFYSQRVDEVIGNQIADPNVAYTLHYYAASHKKELRALAQQALAQGLPLFVTEFGVTEADGDGSINEEESKRWWDFLDTHSISYCNWSIADKEELSSVLKPGTGATGKWNIEDLTEAGKFIRNDLRTKNPMY